MARISIGGKGRRMILALVKTTKIKYNHLEKSCSTKSKKHSPSTLIGTDIITLMWCSSPPKYMGLYAKVFLAISTDLF